MVEVKVPTVGESIQEVQIGQWLKREGDWIAKDENLVELETEKASVQVPSPVSGFVRSIRKPAEQFATIGEVIADIEPSEKGQATVESTSSNSPSNQNTRIMPAARRVIDDNALAVSSVVATGPGGRILKEDALKAVDLQKVTEARMAEQGAASRTSTVTSSSLASGSPERTEEVKPLSMIRRTIAARLVHAQQTAALLTTFNEVDMQPVMDLRQKYRDAFQERHGVKLGFMSFFAKASVESLRRFPAVNAEMRGNNIAYRHFADIGIAIGGGKGLVVPVLRNVEKMSFADVERNIGDFARKAMENRLMPEDLEGGTFTISNGGIYGSLLSTPIVNPPQSAILGLHTIQERPIARDGQVIVRPMMYLALTYDHRIIDGREAVGFLKTVKEIVEDPTRLFLEI